MAAARVGRQGRHRLRARGLGELLGRAAVRRAARVQRDVPVVKVVSFSAASAFKQSSTSPARYTIRRGGKALVSGEFDLAAHWRSTRADAYYHWLRRCGTGEDAVRARGHEPAGRHERGGPHLHAIAAAAGGSSCTTTFTLARVPAHIFTTVMAHRPSTSAMSYTIRKDEMHFGTWGSRAPRAFASQCTPR